MKILVTGGAGFIGSNLIKTLLAIEHYNVICLDNFDEFYPLKIKESNISSFISNDRFQLVRGDLRNTEDLDKIGKVDVIVHLAAKAGVRPSIQNPLLYQDVNVSGTQNLLEFAVKNTVKQFVFASSSSVYGVNENVPWNEEEKLLPISPYASTKLSCEMLGHVYSKLYDIRFIALRFFTVFGPGQRPDLAIHKFFKNIAANQPIPMFGNGSTSRDYTYVEDIVEGIVSAMKYKDSSFEIINLGNNDTITLRELINEIEDVSGKPAVVNYLPEQPGDVPRTFASIEKAKRLLGYQPLTNIRTGLKKFKVWFDEHQELLS